MLLGALLGSADGVQDVEGGPGTLVGDELGDEDGSDDGSDDGSLVG